MNRKVIILSVLLIIGHILTELHSFIFKVYPQTYSLEYDLFLSPSYKMKINFLWYIKMVFDNLLILIVFFVLAKIALSYSRGLFYVVVIYIFYHIADFLSFVWDYKSSHGIYWFLLACTTASVLTVIFYHYHKLKAV